MSWFEVQIFYHERITYDRQTEKAFEFVFLLDAGHHLATDLSEDAITCYSVLMARLNKNKMFL